MDFPPAPAGWNKTLEDLCAEMHSGIRKSIDGQEAEWARNYERSLLPETIRFPGPGDVYEAIDDIEVQYVTHWLAPYTGSGSAIIKQREKIVVDGGCDPEPLGVYALPEDYKLEMRMIPQEDRTDGKYGGFHLSISTRDLNTKFRLVGEGRKR
jgi:hypothetical protein